MTKQEYQKEYRRKNKEKLREYNKIYQRKYFKKNPNYYIYWQCKQRAEKLGLPFDLEKSDIIIPQFCPILGIELKRNMGGKRPLSNSPSVDRIVPEKGYIKDNIQIISHRANVMKNDASIEELRRFADWVINKLKI